MHRGEGRKVVIVTDASPWGIGGWISIDGIILEYFADKITPFDTAVLLSSIGSSSSQQAFEALAILVSLRLWKRHWRNERCTLAVRSDNISALTMTASMKAKAGCMSTLAREMALDIAEGLYSPNVIEHLPGVTNVIADVLSRRYQPGKKYAVPAILAEIPEIVPETRNEQWWRSMAR